MAIMRNKGKRPEIYNRWSAERIEYALRRYFYDQELYTEVFIHPNDREDVVLVSRSGYATVIEIKSSMSDWRNDFKTKAKWLERFDSQIKHFYFAVPEKLIDKMTIEMPDHVGIIGVKGWDGSLDRAYTHKPARAIKGHTKINPKMVEYWKQCHYGRYNGLILKLQAEKFRLIHGET